MRNSKILKVAIASSLVASLAATAAISASAAGIAKVEDIKDHKVGVVGSFNEWSTDGEVALTDNGSGVYEGVIDIENVTEDMVVEATSDDGSGNQVKTGKKGITFKVRLDGDWTDSWGEYEPAYVRTWNSQTNCCAEASVGDHVKITVKLDTTKNAPEAIDAGEADEDEIDFMLIPVEYSVEKVEDTASDDAASDDTAADDAAADDAATDDAAAGEETPAATTDNNDAAAATTPASTDSDSDTTTPATGDTTSAIALVAVVLASLGTAVVMTKKASAKN